MMTPQEYLSIITKRWQVMGITVALGLIMGIILTLITTPMYRSTVKISVNPARPEYGTALTINSLLSNFSLQLMTVRLAQDVVDRLRLDIAPETLLGRIKAIPQQDNFMLLIEVDHPDPQTAEQIAATLATTFVNQYTANNAEAPRQDRIDLSVLDEPEPARLHKPRIEVNVPLGLVAGLLVGIVVAFVWEYLDDTLKTIDDVERVMAMPMLGAIPVSKS